MWVHPALENGAWVGFHNVRGVHIDVQAEDEGGIAGLQLGR